MKLSMLAHPPNPNPTTNTHTTTKMFMVYDPAQPPKNDGGLSTAFCELRKRRKKKKVSFLHIISWYDGISLKYCYVKRKNYYFYFK
jgi:hypothetical protein